MEIIWATENRYDQLWKEMTNWKRSAEQLKKWDDQLLIWANGQLKKMRANKEIIMREDRYGQLRKKWAYKKSCNEYLRKWE